MLQASFAEDHHHVDAVDCDAATSSFDDDINLGDLMRGERATMGKSLEDVQTELRIKSAYIEAIEGQDLEVFPSSGFVPGYVRAYARYLGMDPDAVFARFCEQTGFQIAEKSAKKSGQKSQAREDASRVSKTHDLGAPLIFSAEIARTSPRISLAAIGSTSLLLCVLIGMGLGLNYLLKEVQQIRIVPASEAPAPVALVNTTIDPLDLGSDMDQPNASATAGIDLAMLDENAERSGSFYDTPQSELAMDVLDGPIGQIAPARSVDELTNARPSISQAVFSVGGGSELSRSDLPEDFFSVKLAANSDWDGARLPTLGAPRLSIFATIPAWMKIESSEGVLFEKILPAETSYEIPADALDLRLRTGNSGYVYLRIGEEVFGPVGVATRVAKNVVLSEQNIRATFPKADASALVAPIDETAQTLALSE